MRQLRKIQTSANGLLNWLLQGRDKSNDLPFYTKNMFLNHIKLSFESLERSSLKEKVPLKKFNLEDYVEYPAIEEIHKKVCSNSQYFKHFIVHGSFGDMQVSKGWSDFDSLVVLRQNSFSSSRQEFIKLCYELDEIMRKIDIHQHHGIHFLHERELSNYPNLYLPVNLLAEGKCLLGSDSFYYNRIDSREAEISRIYGIFNTLITAGQTGVLRHHAKNGIYLTENFANVHTMYQLKYFMAVIMLLPTLWLNCLNNYCKKSDSFDIIKSYFNSEDLEILTASSIVRSNWSRYPTSKKSDIDKIPEWVQHSLGSDYLKRGEIFAQKLKKELDKRI